MKPTRKEANQDEPTAPAEGITVQQWFAKHTGLPDSALPVQMLLVDRLIENLTILMKSGEKRGTDKAFEAELIKRWPNHNVLAEVFHNEFYGVNWVMNELLKPATKEPDKDAARKDRIWEDLGRNLQETGEEQP